MAGKFRVGTFVAAAAGLALALPQFAWAHAHLKSSLPLENSVVATAPAQLSMSFSESLEPAFSTVQVVDEKGAAATSGKAALAADDTKKLEVPLRQDLPAGVYTVKWNVLSKDGHKTNGTWTFTVKR